MTETHGNQTLQWKMVVCGWCGSLKLKVWLSIAIIAMLNYHKWHLLVGPGGAIFVTFCRWPCCFSHSHGMIRWSLCTWYILIARIQKWPLLENPWPLLVKKHVRKSHRETPTSLLSFSFSIQILGQFYWCFQPPKKYQRWWLPVASNAAERAFRHLLFFRRGARVDGTADVGIPVESWKIQQVDIRTATEEWDGVILDFFSPKENLDFDVQDTLNNT